MEIEELFCKRYPEYSVNGKPLHPYFDVFEEGYEQAEKENAELKEKARELLNACICKARGNVNPSWSELITDIEQFLRETDIDNAIQKANEGLDLDKIADEVEQDIKEQKVK